MKLRMLHQGLFARSVCITLAVAMASGPSVSAWAQTNAAAQSVRRRVEGLDGRGGDAPPDTTPAPSPDGSQPPQPGGRRPVDRTRTPVRPATAARAASKIDTTYVLPSAVALVVLHPAQLLKSPIAEYLPTEVATAAGLKYLGIEPADVNEVIAFSGMPPEYGVTLKFAKPFKGSAIPQYLRANTQPGELGGRKYLQSGHPVWPSFFAPDANTLVIAPDATLKQLVQGKDQPKSGPLFDRLAAASAKSDFYAAVDFASLRPVIAMFTAQVAGGLPYDVQPYLELLSAAELTVTLSGSGESSLIVHANDEAGAEQIESQLASARAQQFQAQLGQLSASADPVEQALAKYLQRMADVLQPKREGAKLVMFRSENSQPSGLTIAMIGSLVALGFEQRHQVMVDPNVPISVTNQREPSPRNDASMNNLKLLALALLNHVNANNSFPAHAIYSQDGAPLLSWRVKVLPFIEQEALYNEFHLDEPWDSPHNQALIPRMPQVFSSRSANLPPGMTSFLAVVGDQCVFNGTPEGLPVTNIVDGSSQTITLVEADADRAVEWTKPDDLQFDPNNPTMGLGHIHAEGWLAAFADGSVKNIANTMDAQSVIAMFTCAAGDVVAADNGAVSPQPPNGAAPGRRPPGLRRRE